MDEDKKDLDLSHEEQIAEQEIAKEVNEDEVRERLAEDLGLDPDEQSDLLDKLVEREKSNRQKLSVALKQKISWRQKAQTSSKPQINSEESKAQKGEVPDFDELVERKITERFEKRELEALKLPDELKSEVQDYAKLRGISVGEAVQSSFIKFRMQEIEREARIEASTPKRSKKGSYASSFDLSKPLNPKDFDFNSPEGIKAWNEAKAAKAKYRTQNNS